MSSQQSSPVWCGEWVAERLALTIETDSGLPGLTLPDLVGIALRRNPKRAQLLVSKVLGKHVPTDPRLVHNAGLLLGALVADRILGVSSVPDASGSVLHAALSDGPGSQLDLVRLCASIGPLPAAVANEITVLGYAETATALGHTVAEQLGADYLHSTRRAVRGVPSTGGFQEEHSHATDHLLLPENPALLAGDGPLVLVDDELSTGRTALNTIIALHARQPRRRYLIATLVDLRSAADRDRMAVIARELDADVEVVPLAAGRLSGPADVRDRGIRLVAALEGAERRTTRPLRADLVRIDDAWPAAVRDGGRHGFTASDAVAAKAAAENVAERVAGQLSSDRVLVLGFEELMYAPLLIGVAMSERLLAAGGRVKFSTTTRSPVLAVDDPGYPIRTRLAFAAHDDPIDGPGERFAYNVASAGTDDARFTDIVCVVDSIADSSALYGEFGLLDQLRGLADRVQLVTIPSYRPGVAVSEAP